MQLSIREALINLIQSLLVEDEQTRQNMLEDLLQELYDDDV